MKTARVIAGVLLLCSLSMSQKVGWSTGYLSGWAGIAATDIKWNAYTHMCVFSATPDNNGGCNISMGLTDNSIRAAITEGHKNKVKMLLCVGGAGTGTRFVNATANATIRATFIRNIIARMQQYGFDGVDMDWEEINGKESQYVAIHNELRTELDKITPRPLLTAAIANWMFSSTMSGICPSMDQLNNMSYWTRIISSTGTVSETAIANDMMGLVNKGVPKKLLGVGIGLDYEESGNPEVDCDPRAVAAKCKFAINNGYGGVMVWAIEMDRKKYGASQPCHDTLSHYVPAPVPVLFTQTLGNRTPLFSISRGENGAIAVRYSNISDGSENRPFSIGLYDLSGALVSTLCKGQAAQGSHTVPFGSSIKAGTYIVKLTVPGAAQTAKATVFK